MTEVLAPVGSFSALKAAVYSGADAVYLGLDKFNARMSAENFNKENMCKAIDFAHIFNVKVYVVLNILIIDSEINDLKNTLIFLEKVKVDAVIVQDLSIPYLVRDMGLNLTLHASTQMGINNLYGAKLIESLGFKRVVLARETKLSEIKLIKKYTNLEIEYFVHGALCVSFSGSCLFSALKNQQSGNRGMCLQPCRMKYLASNTNETAYFLSARDQCLIKKMDELIHAGVDSFKIEGRMKSDEYIYNTVKAYKNSIIGLDYKKEIQNSKVSFNRGNYFEGYNFSKKNETIYKKIQGNIGLKIGNIKSITKENSKLYLNLELYKELSIGDGIKIIKNDKEYGGFIIDKIIKRKNAYLIPVIKPFPVGAEIHLTSEKALKDSLANIKKQLPCKIILNGTVNNKLIGEILYKDYHVSITSDYILDEAKKVQEISLIEKQFKKLNETNFKLRKFEYNIKDNVFIPNSILSNLKRNLIQSLEYQILLKYEENNNSNKIDFKNLNIKANNNASKFFVISNIDLIDKIHDMDVVIYKIIDYKNLNQDVLNKLNTKNNLYIKLPLINNTNEINQLKNKLKEYKNINLYVNSISQLQLAKDLDREIIIGEFMNILNRYFIKSEKIVSYVNSLESELNNINNGIYFAYGKAELMHFFHCPIIATTNCTCNNCLYEGPITYTKNDSEFLIERQKIIDCQFVLYNDKNHNILYNDKFYRKRILVDTSNLSLEKANYIINSIYKNKSIINEDDLNEQSYKGVK